MKVVTAVVNNPIFIEIQYHTLKRYMKCEYEFIVFNDAKPFPDFSNGGDITIRTTINDTCARLGIQCIQVNNPSHRTMQCAARRCADSMNAILQYQLEYPDEYLILDSDMFLIAEYTKDTYDTYSAAVVLQERESTIKYIWNGLAYFNIPNMKHKELLNWNLAPKCDVGGAMESWLRNQITDFPSCRDIRHSSEDFHRNQLYLIKHLWSCTWNSSECPSSVHTIEGLLDFIQSDPRNVNGTFFSEIYDNRFLHYRAGGNWMRQNMELHKSLATKLKTILAPDA